MIIYVMILCIAFALLSTFMRRSSFSIIYLLFFSMIQTIIFTYYGNVQLGVFVFMTVLLTSALFMKLSINYYNKSDEDENKIYSKRPIVALVLLSLLFGLFITIFYNKIIDINIVFSEKKLFDLIALSKDNFLISLVPFVFFFISLIGLNNIEVEDE